MVKRGGACHEGRLDMWLGNETCLMYREGDHRSIDWVDRQQSQMCVGDSDEVDHDLNIKIVNYTVTQGVTEPDSIESGTANAKCISKTRFCMHRKRR